MSRIRRRRKNPPDDLETEVKMLYAVVVALVVQMGGSAEISYEEFLANKDLGLEVHDDQELGVMKLRIREGGSGGRRSGSA